MSLIAFVDFFNVYNHKNVNFLRWLERKGEDELQGLEAFPTFGIKFGDFFEGLHRRGDFGLELEFYRFENDLDQQTVETSGTFMNSPVSGQRELRDFDISVNAVGLNGLYRLKLARDDRFPNGRFHPYGGGGVC